jgi:hypothetical protein
MENRRSTFYNTLEIKREWIDSRHENEYEIIQKLEMLVYYKDQDEPLICRQLLKMAHHIFLLSIFFIFDALLT